MNDPKIYDISQEVFGCEVYPSDPEPKRNVLSAISDGELYNLTAFSMCAHNGTHIDAPYHFIDAGKTVDRVPLSSTVGLAVVVECDGVIDAKSACKILDDATRVSPKGVKRLLLKGNCTVSDEAAVTFADSGILLLGTESQSVGPIDAPMAAHLALLGKDVVLLEGLRLAHVPSGAYLLSAAPLLLSGADGAPCRAILIKFE